MASIYKGRDEFYEGLLAGHEWPQKLKKCGNTDRRIPETVLRLGNLDIGVYLRTLAHNYQMN